jgi:hypothetical protein
LKLQGFLSARIEIVEMAVGFGRLNGEMLKWPEILSGKGRKGPEDGAMDTMNAMKQDGALSTWRVLFVLLRRAAIKAKEKTPRGAFLFLRGGRRFFWLNLRTGRKSTRLVGSPVRLGSSESAREVWRERLVEATEKW